MKALLLAAALLAYLGGIPETSQASPPPAASRPQQTQGAKMKITINGRLFAITLADTPAAEALQQQLPLTLNLRDYNRNEKIGQLPQALPANDEAVWRIKAGDILLWQGNSLVIFYESFATPYRYTRLGKIDNTANLKATVGAGNVSVKLER